MVFICIFNFGDLVFVPSRTGFLFVLPFCRVPWCLGSSPTIFLLIPCVISFMHFFFGLLIFFSMNRNFSCHDRCFIFSHSFQMFTSFPYLASHGFCRIFNSSYLLDTFILEFFHTSFEAFSLQWLSICGYS